MGYLESEMLLSTYKQFLETGNRETRIVFQNNLKMISANDYKRALNILSERGSIEIIDQKSDSYLFRLTDKGIIHLKNND